MNWYALVWFILMVVFIGIEASTISMISAWFAAGALCAMVASLLGGQLWLQILLFLVISGGLLALLRPLTKKYFTPKLIKTNVDAVIGTTGTVIQTIDNNLGTGKVKLNGMEWTARSSNHEVFTVNTRIRVDKIEGVKVFVSEAPVSTSAQQNRR